MFSKFSKIGIVLCLWVGGSLLATAAWAGSGRIGTDGSIDLTVNARFPITSAALTDLRAKITATSRILWDATEGQMRLRTVNLSCTPVNEDLADYWVFPGPFRSGSCVDCLTKRGGHVNQDFEEDARVYAHEFGHLGLGLGDEYAEDVTKCGGKGHCISENPPEHSDVNQCLMQEIWVRDDTELCVRANHDPLRGNNTACRVNPPDADGAPCKQTCMSWNVDTLRMETSSQSVINRGESCWETLVRKFPFLRAPVDRPEAAPPAGFVAPDFKDLCRASDTVTLLLDTSTSMEMSVAGANKEVCDNKFDDDKDGKVDETDDCSMSRMEFVKAAARSLVKFGRVTPFRVNLVSFDSSVREHVSFVDALTGLARLEAAIDRLKPGGLTAIGDALRYSRTLIEVENSASKVVMLITDGDNSAGSDPKTEVPAYRAAGIRIFPLGTGDAANSRALREITTATRGNMLDAADPSALVTSMAQQWATYMNTGVLVPQQTYAVSRAAEGQGQIPSTVTVSFKVERGMQRFSAMLAGSLDDMSGFGVRAILHSPGGAVFDSSAPAVPGFEVVQDRFFTLLLMNAPEPGTWKLEISGLPASAALQTGRLIVLADNPEVDLFADIDKTVLTSAADTAELMLTPYYFTGLKDVDWDVRLLRPDGSVTPVAVTPGITPYVYHATVSGFPYAGPYTLEITLRTLSTTTNDPGESRPGTAPPNTRPVPLFERHLRIPLLRLGTDWYCGKGQDDCDGDGVSGESPTADGDRDGVPDAWDSDSDNDEIPDANERGGTLLN